MITLMLHSNKRERRWNIYVSRQLCIQRVFSGLASSALGRKIKDYSFFNYEANEALHVSEEEKKTLAVVIENIKKEYAQNIDKHTQTLIQSNIELLLNYCSRFYDRQFYTREKVNSDVVQAFEKLLKGYFAQDTLINSGLPNVSYFAGKLNLSPNYLSDLLHKFTGKSTEEHIHLQLVDKAKTLLWSTQRSVSLDTVSSISLKFRLL
jgi:AraC family transcriptional activator of pobA